MTRPEKIRLGDLLLQQGLIAEDQLALALEQQMQVKLRLGRILVNNAFVTEADISEALAKQLGIPYINLRNFHLKHELVRLLSESQARQFQAILLEERDGLILVGMADQTDVKAADEISQILNCGIDVVVVTEGQLLESIDRGYSRTLGFIAKDKMR
jgi:MSHA biogenesis protein MshE